MAAPGRKKRGSLAEELFGPSQHAPLVEPVARGAGKAPPRVWEFDRASLALMRTVLERHGWPVKRRDVGAAMLAAQQAGEMDCSLLRDAYGDRLAGHGFIILPQLDEVRFHRPAQTFRCIVAGGVVEIVPPGARPLPDLTAGPPVHLACLYVPVAGPQEDFHASCEMEVLFGGAKGGTKTASVVAESARYCENGLYKAYIFRKSKDALREIVRRSKDLHEALGAAFTEVGKTFTYPSGATVICTHLDSEDAAEVVQGQEPTVCFLDESAQNPHHTIVQKIRAELRSPDKSLRLALRETANPIGPGVPRLKKHYISKCGSRGERVHRTTVEVPGLGPVEIARRFIPSKVTDNPVYRNDAAYMANLLTLPARLKKLLLDGDWDEAEGAYFADLDENRHFLPKGWEIPGYMRLRAGHDWGLASQWALVIGGKLRSGQLVVVDTLFGHRELYHQIVPRWKRWQEHNGRRIDLVTAAPLLFSQREAQKLGAVTDAEYVMTQGFALIKGDESPGSRARKASQLLRLLSWRGHEGDPEQGLPPQPDREPLLVFRDTPGNRVLFAQLEMQVADPDDPKGMELLKVNFDPDAVDEDTKINASGSDLVESLMFLTDAERTNPLPTPKVEERLDRQMDRDFARVIAAHAGRTPHFLRGQ